MRPPLYRLQKVASPVKLSQIGYVNAGFGVGISALAFHEAITLRLSLGAALIIAGVRLVNAGRPHGEPVLVRATGERRARAPDRR